MPSIHTRAGPFCPRNTILALQRPSHIAGNFRWRRLRGLAFFNEKRLDNRIVGRRCRRLRRRVGGRGLLSLRVLRAVAVGQPGIDLGIVRSVLLDQGKQRLGRFHDRIAFPVTDAAKNTDNEDCDQPAPRSAARLKLIRAGFRPIAESRRR